MTNYLFIDASYYIFFRYYALLNWWSLSHKGQSLDNVLENKEFLDKFKKLFKKKIDEMLKKLKLEDVKIYIGKDCKRRNIWRKKFFKDYKEHRKIKDGDNVGRIFKYVYNEKLFEECEIVDILYHENLEADDCIALSTKYILDNNNDANIYIITSDMDYLQLAEERVKLYNLKYKLLTDSRNCYNNAKKDLLFKIITGDKSDGILPVFNRCGKKLFEKYYEGRYNGSNKLEEDLNKDFKYKERYELNKKLIDFDNIPDVLKNIFIKKYKNIL